MSAEEKKRKIIERELIKLGVKDQETLDKMFEEIDGFAKIIIEIYKNLKLIKE